MKRLTSASGRFVGTIGILLFAGVFLTALPFRAQDVVRVTHLAGSLGGRGYSDGSGNTARFSSPRAVALDAAANAYVADSQNHTIRKITPTGQVATLAGMPGVRGSADGEGSAARFNAPSAIAVDTAGNIFVADTENHTIRQITTSGSVTTLAGLAGTSGSADGTGSAARFSYPAGLVLEGAGNLLVADGVNHTIRMVSPTGSVTTFAGKAGVSGSANGDRSAARFNYPTGLAVDTAGNIFVSDNQTIRQITTSGSVTTLAGKAGETGSTDGTGDAARFKSPQGLALDGGGNIYVADSDNCTIRLISSGAIVTTVAGIPRSEGADHPGCGSDDGVGSLARFYFPNDVDTDASGNVYVADTFNHSIRKLTSNGVVTTVAGMAAAFGSVDAKGSAARFHDPRGPSVDTAGNIYIADRANHTIRKVSPQGDVTTLAGLPGSAGSDDGLGSLARFNGPAAVVADRTGFLFVADSKNHTIRQITPEGLVTTLAGTAGLTGTADGTGGNARFSTPSGITIDSSGLIYVADTNNNTIRTITSAGTVTTLAGEPLVCGSTDGTGRAARFCRPSSVAADPEGSLYVADKSNQVIRKVTPAGVVTTAAGVPDRYCGSVDGPASAARFCWPEGVAVDAAGNVFVGDERDAIREITASGDVRTIAGASGTHGCEDGTGDKARFDFPSGLAVDGAGNVYVTEFRNHALRKIEPYTCGTPPAPVLTASTSATSGATYLLSWSGTSADNSYELQESTDSTFAGAITESVTGTSHDTSHASPAQTVWHARVRAVQSCSGTTYLSEWSNTSQTSIATRQRAIRRP